MGKLVDWGKDVAHGAGDVFNSMKSGSKKIARKLGYGAVVSSLNPSPQTPPAQPVIPLPDEEAIARIRRRRAAQRGVGRSSTILASDGSANNSDTFGP